MASVVDVRVHMQDVDNAIKAMQANAKDMNRVMRALKPFARKDQKAHAAARRGENGPWPARDPDTIKRLAKRGAMVTVKKIRRKRNAEGKLVGGGKIMGRMTDPMGKLPSSIRFRSFGGELIGDTPVKWAGAHNSGPTSVGRGSTVPERNFLWWSDEFITLALNAIEDYVVQPFLTGSGSPKRIKIGRVG